MLVASTDRLLLSAIMGRWNVGRIVGAEATGTGLEIWVLTVVYLHPRALGVFTLSHLETPWLCSASTPSSRVTV